MTTKIQWVKNLDGTPGETWNPITGCSPCSEGCLNCYAKRLAEGRLRGRYGYPADNPFQVTVHHERLIDIQKLRDKPHTIFVCSMGDLFHEDVEFLQLWEIFQRMRYELAFFQQHKFIILTKRPKRMLDFWNWHKEETGKYPNEYKQQIGDDLHTDWTHKIYPNIWPGVSVENQERADERLPWLFRIHAAVRIVSAEPLLGPIDFKMSPAYINWVICGGETGSGARPMHPNWIRSIRNQCVTANIPFFLKSWGLYGSAMINISTGHQVFKMFPNKQKWINKGDTWVNGGICVDMTGKIIRCGADFDIASYPVAIVHKVKKSGNELDGQIWDQMPEVR